VDRHRSALLWKFGTLIGGALAAAAATRLVDLVWRKVTKAKPPAERAPGSTTRRRELTWVIASGVTVALSRFVVRRAMARVWRAQTGHYPEPLLDAPQPV
jgi:hypothetical protein